MSHRGILLALLLAMAAPVGAAETGTFDVSLRGLKAGVLSYSGDEAGGRYAASGGVRAAGLARALVEAEVDTRSEGRVTGNRYRPTQYTERENKDGADSVTRYAYRGGKPAITRDPPRSKPPKYPVPSPAQAGTIDPMTAAFAMLRDRPGNLACALDIDIYDGNRLANIRYGASEPRPDGGLTCRGEYRRVAGFSPQEMSEKPVWPFTVVYAPHGNGLRVVELQVPTTFGTVRMRRR